MSETTIHTRWFTFGQSHIHRVNGKTFDADCVVKISALDPRQEMCRHFGNKWAFEYEQEPDIERFYPRGVIEL